MKIKRALISVSDKTGLDEFVKGLHALGVEILSTGGTAKYIKEIGVPVKDVSSYTGFPEMMNGRVKTLHPKIHGGLLALRDNKEHMDAAKKNNIDLIDLVCVNLYPFEQTIAKKDVTLEQAIENIDIGGPSMLRSAAKNYKSVAVVTSCEQYTAILKEMKNTDGQLPQEMLKELAVKVFEKTASYDNAIYRYLSNETENNSLQLTMNKVMSLRYGENPHQKADFYKDIDMTYGIAAAKQLQGKELSFNNIMDLNAALEIVKEFDEPAAVIIKHTNPCGAATGLDLKHAYIKALECDRLSAFGSIIGVNGSVDKQLAEIFIEEAGFIECVIAPEFSDEAKTILSQKKNLRLLELPDLNKHKPDEKDYKKVLGGLLVQDRDIKDVAKTELKVVTKTQVSEKDLKELFFAWKIVKHVKSNAIVICNGSQTVGIGAGQMSRVDSVIVAKRKAGEKARGGVLASDAFFPMSDNIEVAYEAGIKAIIQPGGSVKDQEVIDACDKYGIAMVFTGMRHFRH
ncbi:MAG: bifunctional phosphoribosylaminoimidazolecarboxamide formyltransferase/IMP cyclohydrolase [Candidatus Omnitrophica bacterium]|nr:bifunctional phosphoribosylaminoimidazolecarboxamide formyltransferase/IMP cyclohydrolase [Candidatus Omnitrophota bacterium]